MPIKVIVELQAKPGKRDELKKLSQGVAEKLGPTAVGFLGTSYFEVIDNPDMLVEIATWESVEARVATVQKAMASGVYAPILALLAAPFRATVIREIV